MADLKERIEKSHFSPDMLANGERVKGIVTRITDKGADIRLGKYSGFIDNAQLSWAKKTLRSKQKFLESGDVVWVAAVSDPKNPYNPDEAELNKPIRQSLQCVPELQGALISIEPETGDVVAMVGGYSFQESQFNRATQAFRQPGSSFKPIVYSAALDNGFTAASVILDAPVVSSERRRVASSNYEKNFGAATVAHGAGPVPAWHYPRGAADGGPESH
ncbi:MAG: penicillin-binding transpeptidase domain-containing protein [Bilophila wadsworthia]